MPIPPCYWRFHLPTIDKHGFISKSPTKLTKPPLSKHIPVLLGVDKKETSFIPDLVGINDTVISKEENFRYRLRQLFVVADNAPLDNIRRFYLRPFLPGEPQSYQDDFIDIG